MEGLIPYLIHVLKKQQPQRSFRSQSMGSGCSYHLLAGQDSFEGSSHRPTRSDFLPATTEFLDQRSGLGHISPQGYSSSAMATYSKVGSVPQQKYKANHNI